MTDFIPGFLIFATLFFFFVYDSVLTVQRSLTVVRPSSQAFHHAITCEYRVMFAIFVATAGTTTWWRTRHVQKKLLTGSRGGVNATRLRQ